MSTAPSPLDDVRRALAEAVAFYTSVHAHNVLPVRYAIPSLVHLSALDKAAATLEQTCNEAQHKEQQAS